MEGERFRQVIDVVGDAMALPAAERDAFIARAFANDAELLEEARSLVAEANDTSFGALTARLGSRIERAAAEVKAHPKQIGPYKILGVLGEGGMGVVYHAEQSSPIKREVALKIVRGGLRGENARARFEAERQALAVMNHPGIARILDAGATDDGTPYFAMELVRGESITAYCDAHQLDLDARLDLFAEVCRAVQHAHINGVIHRDLKPSNILISTVDGRAQPRVIDFGIAKAVEAASDKETMHTAFGAVMGTLEYMSPEQASGGTTPVDTRSDVYALGVILYELVTGALPFDSAALRNAGAIEAQRLIRDTDPPTPARRFTTSATQEVSARARGTDARSLKKRLDGDLGWIIMKALEKDPARRYQSASDLAGDLGRLRAHQPVDAGPPGKRYRAGRFVRRHRTGVVAASIVLVALLSGITLATVGFVRAKHAQARAENEAERANKIRNYLTKMLAQSRPDHSRGRDVTVMEMVDSTAAQMARDRLFADDPLVRADILHALAETYRTRDDYARAIPMFQESIALKRAAAGTNDRSILVTLNKLAECQAITGDLKAAIETQKDVVATAERALGKETDDYSAFLMNLGNMYADAGDPATAEPLLRESLAIQRRVNQADDDNLPFSINNLATVLVDEGKCADAIPLHQESLALRRQHFGAPSAELATALGNYARALDCAERYEDARAAADSGLAMCITVFGPNHQRTATARVRLAEVLLHTGHAAEAEPLLLDAVAIFSKISQRQWRVGDARARLGEVWIAEGRGAKGVAEMETGWQILTETTGSNTRRSKEIAAVISGYYDRSSDKPQSEEWGQRASATSP